MQTLRHFEVFHDFSFTDRRAGSGLDFENRVTEDSGKDYRANHYDHGNGVAVADINGDGLLDLYLTTFLGSNGLFQNLGGGQFRNVTETAGVGLPRVISVTASFADVDNDGDPDLYVTTVRMGNHLFLNEGDGTFRDVTREAGLEYVGHSSGAMFFDYDLDGNLDLFLVNVGDYTDEQRGLGGYYLGYGDAFQGHLYPERTETSILYRNLGDGRFEDVSELTGLVDGSWSGDATFTDLDLDGDPDVYIPNMQGDDHYWENVDGKTFVDSSAKVFPVTPWGTMGIEFFDSDNDGDQDLILSDMHSDMSRDLTPGFEKVKSMISWDDDYLQDGSNNIFGNAFYRNLGEGRFEEVSDDVNTENYWPWGLTAGDLNADGWEDVFITSSMNFPFRYGVNTLLLNNRGQRFLDSEFILGVEPREAGFKAYWFDLDCSGVDQLHQLCKGRGGKYAIWASVGSRSSAFFDLEGDGDLDIVTNEFNGPPLVLVSNLSDRKEIRYLEVRLVGTVSNRDALGATVRVQAGDQVYTRYNDGKSGYLSQSSKPLYFGLGEADAVSRVEVTWPSGRTQTISEGIEMNSLLEIVEE